jgi:hypothetical protein
MKEKITVNNLKHVYPNGRRTKQNKCRLFVSESHDRGLFTHDVIRKGQIATSFFGEVVSFHQANAKSLQLSSELFLRGNGDLDEFLNHSCAPNCAVIFEDGFLPYTVAAREIAAGEELTFNYNCTEWNLLEQEDVFQEQVAFVCMCKSDLCLGQIHGFTHLSLEQKLRLSAGISPFLRLKLMEELWLGRITAA